MQIFLYGLAGIGAAALITLAAAFLRKSPDPATRLREQHLERWGNKP